MAVSQILFFAVSLALISHSLAQGPIMPPMGPTSMPPMNGGGGGGDSPAMSPSTPPPSMPMTPPPMIPLAPSPMPMGPSPTPMVPMTPSPTPMTPSTTPMSPSPSPTSGMSPAASPPSPPGMESAHSPGPADAGMSPDVSSPGSGAFSVRSDVVFLSFLAGVAAHFLIM